jgi:epoxide hydrolase-like predicted phosphatase
MIKVVLFDYGRVLYGPILPQRKVRRLASELRAKGLKTGILSNTFFTVPWILQILGGYRGFDPIVLSSKEGVAKPDAKIYRIAIERAGVKPDEIIFIDNLEENVRAAKKLGLKVVRAKNSNQVVADTKQILLEENGLKF